MTITDTHTDIGWIATSKLSPHPDNLRQDLGDLTELAASIDAVGIIQPIVIDAEMRVLAGHRRLAAAQQLGLTEVPVTLRTVRDDADVVEVFLIENLQRAGLNPIEEGTGYARLADLGLTQREIAERVGCNQSHVSKRITLAGLPGRAREWVAAGRLKVDDALEIAKAGDDAAAVVDELKHYNDSDRSIERWAVSDAVTRVAGDKKRAKSIEAGKASKLKRIKTEPSKYYGEFEPCKKAEATHWYVADRGRPTIVWARKREAQESATTGSRERWIGGRYRPAEEADAGEQRLQEMGERRDAVLNELIVGEADRVVVLAAQCALAQIGRNGHLNVGPYDYEPGTAPEVAFALMVLEDLASSAAERIVWGHETTAVTRAAYDALVELGYELDDDERAALPGLDVAAELAKAAGMRSPSREFAEAGAAGLAAAAELIEAEAPLLTDEQFAVVDLAPELSDDEPVPHDEISAALWYGDEPAPDAEAAALAADTDPFTEWAGDDLATLQATAPWKAYPVTRPDVKLVGHIREHKNPDKLRHAVVYERANGARELVLAALAERIEELEA